MSEGDMQEQAALDSIKALRKKAAPKKAAPKKPKYEMDEGDMQEDAALQSAKSARNAMSCGGKVKKYKSGGMCRGGRAATRGTKFVGVR
jgi:hypothetical protein